MAEAAEAASPRRPGHLIEYALEALGLGLFMVSAAGFGVLLFHPASPVVAGFPDPLARRALMGLAMGATAALNVYAPWGRRSGAHLNPAVTVAFWRLGKIGGRDVAGYVAGQFAGGMAGTLLAAALLRPWIGHPEVNYVVTTPGRWGIAAAFLAELLITFLLMSVVLVLLARPRAARWTGAVAASLVTLYITLESPVSGMSMNPARTFGSALPAGHWTALWLYFVAPPLGMLAAVELRRRRSRSLDHCAKLHHDPRYRCLFCGHRPVHR